MDRPTATTPSGAEHGGISISNGAQTGTITPCPIGRGDTTLPPARTVGTAGVVRDTGIGGTDPTATGDPQPYGWAPPCRKRMLSTTRTHTEGDSIVTLLMAPWNVTGFNFPDSAIVCCFRLPPWRTAETTTV